MGSRKTMLVVGATGGLGSPMSHEFYRAGMNLGLGARRVEGLLRLRETLGVERTLIRPTDAVKRLEVEKLFEFTKQEFGRVDAVVISVGKWIKSTANFSPEEADKAATLAWQSIFEPARIVADVAQRFFRGQAGGGLIAHISSHAANRFLAENMAYGPAKAAATRYMLNLRGELAGTDVRVTDIQPMIVKTPETIGLITAAGFKPEDAVQAEDIAGYIIHNIDNRDIPAERRFECKAVL